MTLTSISNHQHISEVAVVIEGLDWQYLVYKSMVALTYYIRFRKCRNEEHSLILSPVMKDVPDLRKSGLE